MSEAPALLRLGEIVKNGLCMGCGLCRSAFGEKLSAREDADGLERPVERHPLDAAETKLLNAVCPGLKVSFPPTEAGADHDPMWGNITRLAQGFSAEPEIRFMAATGGVLTALALHLIETGKAAFILHVRSDPDRPLLSQAWRSTTRDQVLEGARSRYTAAAPLTTFMAALDEGRPFSFVGKPCDVTAVSNLARLDPRVDQLCVAKLTMVCGGFSEKQKFDEVMAGWGVAEDEAARFDYRGLGCPGLTSVTTKDGRFYGVPYWVLWGNKASWRSYYRCKICPDAIGLSADVAALDVWDDADPQEEDAGWNAMIARTARGKALLEAAVDSGHLTIDGDWTVPQLDKCQPHQLRKRKAVKARYQALAESGLPHPLTEDPGLETVSYASGSDDYNWEYKGTLKRIDRGDHKKG